MVHDIVLSNKWMTYKRMLKELGLILCQHVCVIKGCMFFAVAYIGRYGTCFQLSILAHSQQTENQKLDGLAALTAYG